MWYVGQKVVCVEAGTSLCNNAYIRDTSLVLGRIYTVLGVKNSCCDDSLRLLVEGNSNTVCAHCGNDTGGNWKNERRFRPIDALTEQMERIESEGCPVELEPEYA